MAQPIILPCKYPNCPGHVDFEGEGPSIPISAFKLFYHITPDKNVLFSLLDEQGDGPKQLEEANITLREVRPDTFIDPGGASTKKSITTTGLREYILPYTAATQTHDVYLKCDDLTIGPHTLPYKLTY